MKAKPIAIIAVASVKKIQCATSAPSEKPDHRVARLA
jgi:hypothetical protein